MNTWKNELAFHSTVRLDAQCMGAQDQIHTKYLKLARNIHEHSPMQTQKHPRQHNFRHMDIHIYNTPTFTDTDTHTHTHTHSTKIYFLHDKHARIFK